MDGTLVDTDYANYLAYQKAIKAVVNTVPLIDFDPFNRFNSSALQNHFPNLSVDQYRRIVELKNYLFSDYLSETVLIPDVSQRLKEYHQNKKTVLVTNAHFERAMQTLRFHGLDSYISVAFCSDHRCEVRNKYQHAINCLQADESQVVVYENDVTEVDKALRAGVLNENIVVV